MNDSPIRRAQVVAPFGVGALFVARDGSSLIGCGLDHWYEHESGEGELDEKHFIVNEWRLERILKVNHFRCPPDYRTNWSGNANVNLKLTIPYLRFPTWYYCNRCGRLKKLPLTVSGKVKCSDCERDGKTRYLVQVPFVAICENGHIQDFPWREWVHRSSNPVCDKTMRLKGTGGATLASLHVECECGEKRSLAGIMNAGFLSEKLDKTGKPYLCQGMRPWHGTEETGDCDCQLRGSLRSASNLYFAEIRSSIYLPRGNDNIPPELISILEGPEISQFINILSSTGQVNIKPEMLRKMYSSLLQSYNDDQVQAALDIVLSEKNKDPTSTGVIVEGDDPQTSFRREEFNVLTESRDEDELRIKEINIEEYCNDIKKYFSRIMLVEKLRETRVLAGFKRIYPENNLTLDDMKSLMWKKVPGKENLWLPAYVVYGEGIFLEFNESKLQEWIRNNSKDIDNRLKPLVERYQQEQQDRHLRERAVGPRFILLHTFAHLLINRLTFECGYSSASLRERLYVSDNVKHPMAGVLIYTAAGDSEGTLGGLVRMGKPGYLEPVIRRALESASWCSADPVCMEMGSQGGQGPNSCNLAACHNCALVPETSCEEFNMFLDRALVVGDLTNKKLGFFNI